MYYIWRTMKQRCTNPNNYKYKNYGGRGIKVCDEWMADFKAFYDWAVTNGYREDLTIDRIDVDGNYEPSNCRWATYSEQANNRTTNRIITFNGEPMTMANFCRKHNLNYRVFAKYIKQGCPIEYAIKKAI